MIVEEGTGFKQARVLPESIIRNFVFRVGGVVGLEVWCAGFQTGTGEQDRAFVHLECGQGGWKYFTSDGPNYYKEQDSKNPAQKDDDNSLHGLGQ